MKPQFRIRKWQPVDGELSGRVRFFNPENPDGVTGDPEIMVAFCPRCTEKKNAAQHEECPYFRGEVVDENGAVSAVICAYPEEHFTDPSREP